MIDIKDIELVMTCGACPEQYDAFYQGTQVGYLRLRHGYFSVDAPDCGGDTIYEAEPQGDGMFDDDERDCFLTEAKCAIAGWMNVSSTIWEGHSAGVTHWQSRSLPSSR